MTTAWGAGTSIAARLRTANPAPPPAAPAANDDGSRYPAVPLNTASNYTAVMALLVTDPSRTRVRLVRESDGKWDMASECWEPGHIITDTLHVVMAKSLCDQSLVDSVRLACVEHYPSLAQQWLRFTYALTINDTGADNDSDSVRWFAVSDVRARKIELSQSNVITVIDEVLGTGADSEPQPSSVPSPAVPVDWSLAGAGSVLDTSHLAVSVALTVNNHVLAFIGTDTTNTLPVTHCDKGETLTFTADRLMRARFGLMGLTASVSCIHYHQTSTSTSADTGSGAHIVLHCHLDGESVSVDPAFASAAKHSLVPEKLSTELVSSLSSSSSPVLALRSNRPFTLVPLTDSHMFAGQMRSVVKWIESRTCELSTASAHKVGVPIIHVKTEQQQQ